MARTARFKFSHTRKLDSAYRYVSEASDAGVILQTGEGANGRFVTIDGNRLANFGSCSYMALEAMEQLRACAHRALDEYGTQFHFSRAYLQCPLYLELEALLEEITGRPVVVAASTSLAHIAATPLVLVAGAVWLCIHGLFLVAAGRLLRAPMSLLAAASQANIGGPASAPVVAGIYQPGLAPVGLLLAILGNILGTYAGLSCTMFLGWLNGLLS